MQTARMLERLRLLADNGSLSESERALLRRAANRIELLPHNYEAIQGAAFGRYRVPGGWLYERYEAPIVEAGSSALALAFVPDRKED